MYEISRKLSAAYWPNPELNESARREDGDKVVDSLTISELSEFYKEVQTGPTYCMVTRRLAELFPTELFHSLSSTRRLKLMTNLQKAVDAIGECLFPE